MPRRGGDFPRIDIDVAANGFFCHDSVFVIHAAPLSATGVDPGATAVQAAALPSPFRDMTRISFQMPSAGAVYLTIHDVAGRVVRTLSAGRWYGAGPVSFVWDGRSDERIAVPTGVYFARFEGAGTQGTLRIALVR